MSWRPQIQTQHKAYNRLHAQQSDSRHYRGLEIDVIQNHITGAEIMQQALNSNLARKFIDCWRTLKSLTLTRVNSQQKIRHQSKRQRPEQRLRQDHSSEQKTRVHRHFDKLHITPKERAENNGYKSRHSHRSHRSHSQRKVIEQEIVRLKTIQKHTRQVDVHTEISRAKILNEIAQRLRTSKSAVANSHQTEIVQKINKLQKLMKEIKTTNQHSDEYAVSSRVYIDRERGPHNSQQEEQSKDINIMFRELSQLKNQIQDIKNNKHETVLKQSTHLNKGMGLPMNRLQGVDNMVRSSVNYNYNTSFDVTRSRNQSLKVSNTNFLHAPSLQSFHSGSQPHMHVSTTNHGFHNFPITTTHSSQRVGEIKIQAHNSQKPYKEGPTHHGHISNFSHNNVQYNQYQTYIQGERCPLCGRNCNHPPL